MSVNEKKKITNKRYTLKCDNMNIRPLKAHGQRIRDAAAASGQSLQGYILQAIDERMERDAHTPAAHPLPSSEAPDEE